MKLDDEINLVLRSFQKFNDFLAATGAMISNLLLIFVIIMTYVNKIKGKNILMTSMYSYDILNNLTEFYGLSKGRDSNHKLDSIKAEGNMNINMNTFIQSNQNINNPDLKETPFKDAKEFKESKAQNVVEISIKDLEKQKRESKIESFLTKEDNESMSQQLINKSNDYSENQKLEIMLKELKEKDFDFSVYHYLRSLIKDDHQSKFYKTACNDFDHFIEVNEYIYLKQEFSLLKKLMFDKYQIEVFENISKFLNFSNLIKEKKDVKRKNIKDSLDKVYQRNNSKDKKLIRFIEEIHRKLNK